MDTTLIAIKMSYGEYSVHSQMQCVILDEYKLLKSGKLRQVQVAGAYLDYVGIMTIDEIYEYLNSADHYSFNNPYDWLAKIKDEVKLIMVHYFEWESGLD